MTSHEITLLLLGAMSGSLLSTAANLGVEMAAVARARRRAARHHFRGAAKVISAPKRESADQAGRGGDA